MLEDLKASQVLVGTRQTMKAVRADQAERVYLALDADAPIKKEVEMLCENHGVEITFVNSMSELGTACGIERKTAAAVLLKE
ncbi:ribosomal L7Ae/L30e/S12e/Gadd45 family protein [Alkalibacter rhizosphaerae]|uniref:Ribosomal L7Ae/L30e/S12e/Gadd45 family protein n=1 Tax=Alkalibacter rhizosphaerae TaxID=2815577 RepID=A0A975AHH5_9FIRM|nr:ribosomal L7Ae/L30e/S12e/Gadd45 family protein [Alkalibacter rhizosphaerae]QSX07495.1 ribosomal L7Ae/L30e/S12e/Gadd45 family protein [Alkalibacter rhizosphaerae]